MVRGHSMHSWDLMLELTPHSVWGSTFLSINLVGNDAIGARRGATSTIVESSKWKL